VIVGALELTVTFYASSLKDKRSIVRRIMARTKGSFNVSVAEVDELDNPNGAVIGFSSVGNDAKYLSGQLDSLVRFVEDLELAEVVDVRRELLRPR
jgi:uncharacterized protein YlxP (DUF503 family)